MSTPDSAPEIDIKSLSPELLKESRRLWASRIRSEYQSIQIANRLLSEALAAGESLATHRVVLEMVQDELRHAELCASMCRALGVEPPAPTELAAPLPDLGAVPIGERLLASAISLFLVNETFSVAYIRDLSERCSHPIVGPVLAEIGGDEDEHEAFGETFVARRLALEPHDRRESWKMFTAQRVAPHLEKAAAALARVPEDKRALEHHPEPELANLGLLGPARLALLTQQTHRRVLGPRLQRLGLAD